MRTEVVGAPMGWRSARPWLVLAGGGLVLGLYIARYPPTGPPLDWTLFTAPQPDKLLSLLRSLVLLGLLDGAVWVLGTALHRRLLPGPEHDLSCLERFGL